MSSINNHTWEIHESFSQWRIENDEMGHIPIAKLQNHFIRGQTFNLQSDPHMKKNHSKKRRSHIYQNKEV